MKHEPPAQEQSIFVVSLRGPFAFQRDTRGELQAVPAGGSLSRAMSALGRSHRLTWIAAAIGDDDPAAAASTRSWPMGNSQVLLAELPPAALQLHRRAFANPLLWLLQHGMEERLMWPYAEDAIWKTWSRGYRPVNEAMADAVVAAARGASEPVILVQDYHLYLVPRLIREAIPNARIAHFVHIPWARPHAWSLLPNPIMREILAGLMGADVVGFQTEDDAERFTATCDAYGLDLENDTTEDPLHPLVRVFPMTVEQPSVQDSAAKPTISKVAPLKSDMCNFVQVGELDPRENTPAALRAFGLLLERRPDFREHARLVAYLPLSRADLPEYQDEKRTILSTVQLVNARFGNSSWQPIEVNVREDPGLERQLLIDYDALLVPTLADGMNFIAKEGPLLNQRRGVLILSSASGAWHELQSSALTIDPKSLTSMTDAMELAIDMGPTERQRRADGLRAQITGSTVDDWLDDQLAELGRVAEPDGVQVETQRHFSPVPFLRRHHAGGLIA
ncbi:MAG TPA: trehalose-6-phosphate synthase [Chloroflexota bacterium]